MSTVIDQAFVNQFTNNVTVLYQQEGSKLRPFVNEKQSIGEFEFFERVAPTEVVEKTVRHSETQRVNVIHTRRRLSKKDWRWAEFIDENDLHRILIDPRSSYTQIAAMSMGRRVDKTIIEAFNAAAQEGKDGSTSTAFPAAQQIANGGTNMTVAKLRDAAQTLDDADVPEGDRMLVHSPASLNALLGDPLVTSTDSNVIQALVGGQVDSYLGARFIKSTLLSKTGNIRSTYMWHRMAMGLGVGMELRTMVDRLPEHDQSIQVWMGTAFGAIRIQDEGVVEIDIDETA